MSGIRYDIEEWAMFLYGDKTPGCRGDRDFSRQAIEDEHGSLEAWQGKVFDLVSEVVLSSIDEDMGDHELHECAYLTVASLTGEGVGLWEGRDPRHTKLEPLVKSHDGLAALVANLV